MIHFEHKYAQFSEVKATKSVTDIIVKLFQCIQVTAMKNHQFLESLKEITDNVFTDIVTIVNVLG